MPVLDINVQDAQEYSIVTENLDKEYKLTVTKAEIVDVKSRQGQQQIKCVERIEGAGDFVFPIVHYFQFPQPEDDPATVNMKKLNIKQFLEAHGIALGPQINTDEWIGKSAWALLDVQADEGFQPRNRVRQWIKPATGGTA